MKSAARPVSISEAVEPGPPAQLVLVHDGAGVTVGEPVLVGQPVRALLAAQERGTGFEACEPLRECSSGDGRDARDQVLMRFRGVVQSQLAPPGGTPASVETASRPRSWQPPGPTSSKRGGALREPAAHLVVTWSGSGRKRRVASQDTGAERIRTAARPPWPFPARRPRTSSPGRTSCRGTGGCSAGWR